MLLFFYYNDADEILFYFLHDCKDWQYPEEKSFLKDLKSSKSIRIYSREGYLPSRYRFAQRMLEIIWSRHIYPLISNYVIFAHWCVFHRINFSFPKGLPYIVKELPISLFVVTYKSIFRYYAEQLQWFELKNNSFQDVPQA